MPSGPWIMVQKWHGLLFVRWALPAEQIQPLVSRELELDLWQGQDSMASRLCCISPAILKSSSGGRKDCRSKK